MCWGEATAFIGAEPHQRTDGRTNLRNGTRPKTLTTAAGDVDLGITKLRQARSSPRCSSAAEGSIRRCTRWSWRPTSPAPACGRCADLDEQVADFADRTLTGQAFPYVFLDATYCKARVGGARNGKGSRVVSQAIVGATGPPVRTG